MQRETVDFQGSDGAAIDGVLTWPDGDARDGLVLAHCFTCGKDIQVMTRVASGLAEAGYASLRIDLTDKTLTANVADVESAVAVLDDRIPGRVGIFGHSFGGVAGLMAASRADTVAAVAVLNTPATAQHLRGELAHVVDEVRREGTAEVMVAGRKVTLSVELFDDLERHDLEASVAALGCPLLVLQSEHDDLVPPAEAEALMLAAREPKTHVVVDGADHLVTSQEMSKQVVRALTGWLHETLAS